MKKKFLIAFILSAFIFPVFVSAATINAASCSYDDVPAAINSAQSGDTVLVPAGSCTWNNPLVITKGIILKAATVGGTTITGNITANAPYENFLITYTPATPSLNEAFRISGFIFDLNYVCHGITLGNPTVTPVNKIRIDHNTIKNANSAQGSGMTLIRIVGAVYGVADNNTLQYGLLIGYGRNAASWNNLTFDFGTADNFYFEDNAITADTTVGYGGASGRYCIRHNTITAMAALFPFCDAHGNMGMGGNYATMGVEIYNNTVNANDKTVEVFYLRGGKALIFDNIINTAGSVYGQVHEEFLDSLNPPASSPISGQPQHVSDSYLWNNLKNGNTQVASSVVGTLYYSDLGRNVPTANADFWDYTASFDGTNGVGVGILSARPSTCIVGVGYWANDESKLYRCTATNTWTLYYTPYTYPHPLRTDCVNYPGLCDSGSQSSGIIPAERLIEWQPGIPGGIPNRTTICANVKNAPYNAFGDGVHDDTAAINAAITSCLEGQVVFIPAGTYYIDGSFHINKGIVVRGEGPQKTRIIQYGSKNIFEILGGGEEHIADVISGFSKGSDTVVVSDASNFNVDALVLIDQLNDPSLVFINGSGGWPCNWCGREDGNRSMGEEKIITSKNGNTITFNRPLYYDYKAQFQPQLVQRSGGHPWSMPVRYAGIEDLAIEYANGTNLGIGILMEYCIHSWVKNVESSNTAQIHIDITYGSYGNEVRECYVHGTQPGFFTGSRGYGINIDSSSTDNLIEDNIFYYLHCPVTIGSMGGTANVIAYNFFEKTSHTANPNWFMPSSGTHGAHTYMNLWEGNVMNKFVTDSYWGSGSHNILFRNWVNGQTTCTQELTTVSMEALNYYNSVVGNVLGSAGQTGSVEQIPFLGFENNRVIWRIGYLGLGSSLGYPDDPKVNQTLIRHGNYDYISHSTAWDPSIADRNIPNSLYLTSKPSWFGDLPWPPIGPDANPMNGTIPAKQRFDAIMGSITNCTAADLNCDTKVDVQDLIIIAGNFGKTSGFNSRADTNGNGVVDIFDAVYVASRFT